MEGGQNLHAIIIAVEAMRMNQCVPGSRNRTKLIFGPFIAQGSSCLAPSTGQSRVVQNANMEILYCTVKQRAVMLRNSLRKTST